jgi:hypothetical protein
MLAIVVFNPTQLEANLANNKKRKTMYELNCHFQVSWATKLPWEKSITLVLMGRSHRASGRFVMSLKGKASC